MRNQSVARPPSGEHDSGRFVAMSPSESLATALAYWPGRWPSATVLAAIAITPKVRAMSPPEWVDVLDQLSAAVCGALVDTAVFP